MDTDDISLSWYINIQVIFYVFIIMLIVKVLLGQGADCTIMDGREWLPLHCAANGGFLDVVSMFVYVLNIQ